MKDGTIPDNQISASGVWDILYAAHEARLDGNSCWTPAHDDNEWIQVMFDTPVNITGVITQGEGHPDNNYWVITYKVKYRNDIGAPWQYVKELGQDKVS